VEVAGSNADGESQKATSSWELGEIAGVLSVRKTNVIATHGPWMDLHSRVLR
jgi:hypothetical protein